MTKQTSTISRINTVMAELAKRGIGKNQKNNYDNYNFRGIDDVYNALAPLLSENGLVIIPDVQSIEVEERQNNKGTALFYKTANVLYTVKSVDDDGFQCHVYGEAMDRGDKAINKAMSAAYKQLCFQLFCIPVQGEDSETESHEVQPNEAPPKKSPPKKPDVPRLSVEEMSDLIQCINGATTLDELKDAWGLVNAAKARMSEADYKGLADQKEAKKGELNA